MILDIVCLAVSAVALVGSVVCLILALRKK